MPPALSPRTGVGETSGRGVEDGVAAAVAVGRRVGASVGVLVGVPVGVRDGAAVGVAVAVRLGTEVEVGGMVKTTGWAEIAPCASVARP